MKTLLTLLISAILTIHAQSDYNSYIETFFTNQNTVFTKSNSESFLIDNTNWSRLYGEKEYFLTPVVQNIRNYETMIHAENTTIVNKSHFSFVNVILAPDTKKLLEETFIYVPTYITGSVLVYLPQIHLDYLSIKGVNYSIVENYGKTPFIQENEEMEKKGVAAATVWSENFENVTIPGSSTYSVTNGAVNCGFGTVSCYSHNGNKSLWCASNGAACNACLGDYVTDMSCQFNPTNYLNVSSYGNMTFKYWMDTDLYDTGSNDEFRRYEDITGGGWVLKATFTSASSDDGQLWVNKSASYSGQTFNVWAVAFYFYSNSIGNSYGVYLDDLSLEASSVVSVEEELENLISISPNPSSGLLYVEGENIKSIEVININGQIVRTVSPISLRTELNLNKYPAGLYSIRCQTSNGVITKKIVLE